MFVRLSIFVIMILGCAVCWADDPYASLDPKTIKITLPADIKWVDSANGLTSTAVLAGDPNKPGYYVILMKWRPGSGSRPHAHPNDRFVNVVSGTWWVATGKEFNKENMKPVPAGSFVVHTAGEVHYDGPKDSEVIVQISGMGPQNFPRPQAKQE